MRRILKLNGLVFLPILLVTAGLLFAAETKPVIAVAGNVPKPGHYTLEQLRKLPVTKITARDHDGTDAEYEGVQVVEVLRSAGAPLGDTLRGKALATAVVVHAADGYQAVFSLAELDPAMTDRATLLAWSRNGEPLAASQGPIRLVVAGEKRQARWVRQVTAIEVISINRPAITNAAETSPVEKP